MYSVQEKQKLLSVSKKKIQETTENKYSELHVLSEVARVNNPYVLSVEISIIYVILNYNHSVVCPNLGHPALTLSF